MVLPKHCFCPLVQVLLFVLFVLFVLLKVLFVLFFLSGVQEKSDDASQKTVRKKEMRRMG